MQQDLSKKIADSLRTFTNEKYNLKLKAAHAHELAAAYFGYTSKNAMLADTEYPVRNLDQADIIVMTSDDFVDQRRKDLKELPSELPESHILGEMLHTSLSLGEWRASSYPPFRSFKELAIFLVENSDAFKAVFKVFRNLPVYHVVVVEESGNDVAIRVFHTHETPTYKTLVGGKTTIELRRVAGYIGYSKPKISVEKWTGGAPRTVESLGVQP